MGIMFRHAVLLVIFSAFLPKSLQEDDELVLAQTKDGKRYIAKRERGQTNNGIEENVGTDYSRVKDRRGKICLDKDGVHRKHQEFWLEPHGKGKWPVSCNCMKGNVKCFEPKK